MILFHNHTVYIQRSPLNRITVEPLLRGHPDERPNPMERPLDNVNLNRKVLISTPDERPPLLKGHFSGAKGVASQEGFHCTNKLIIHMIHTMHKTICCVVYTNLTG